MYNSKIWNEGQSFQIFKVIEKGCRLQHSRQQFSSSSKPTKISPHECTSNVCVNKRYNIFDFIELQLQPPLYLTCNTGQLTLCVCAPNSRSIWKSFPLKKRNTQHTKVPLNYDWTTVYTHYRFPDRFKFTTNAGGRSSGGNSLTWTETIKQTTNKKQQTTNTIKIHHTTLSVHSKVQ